MAWWLEDVDWQIVSKVTHRLHRLRGLARVRGQDIPWSLIVKTSQPSNDHVTVSASDWQREWQAYASGLLHTVHDVRPARLLHTTRFSPTHLTLWLEDVPDDTPELWSLDQHILFARHLGDFNASHSVPEPLPMWVWQDWLPSLDPRLHPTLHDRVWDDPLVRLAFPQPCAAALERVDAAFERWSAQLASLPQTLVHLDAGRFNVRATSANGKSHSVLLDWQSLGVGPVGTDLAMTHFLNVCRFYADPYEIGILNDQGFAAYWTAVRSAGLNVDWSDVHFTYTALSAMRGATVIRMLLPRLASPEGDVRLWVEWGQKRSWSVYGALRAWGHGMQALLTLGEEAETLVYKN